MSWTGQCPKCGKEAMERNMRGISTHSGPEFLRYRRAMVAAFGGVLPEDLQKVS